MIATKTFLPLFMRADTSPMVTPNEWDAYFEQRLVRDINIFFRHCRIGKITLKAA